MADTLLQTKLHRPVLPTAIVTRSRLLDLLDEGREKKLILVSAPAGFGKTTLVASWLQREGVPAAWLALDEGDNDPARFFTYVVAALQKVAPDLPPLSTGPQTATPAAFMDPLINELSGVEQDVFLVLDDYHVIANALVHDSMSYLVEFQPPLLHLVLLTRADPPFPLSRLRARRQLTEVRARDLRFSLAEVTTFLEQGLSLDVSARHVALLAQRTEGWIAGIQLAAHSLQSQEDRDRFFATFAGDDRYVADYLVAEVLTQQPAAVQSFLLSSSILNRLSAPLCDAVLERADSRDILARLDRENMFLVSLDNRRHWYRYHHLFADLLRQRLLESGQPLAPLHERASQWYETQGLYIPAVMHALAAGPDQRTVRLIDAAAPELFQTSQLETLLRWWRRLPADLLAAEPRLVMLYAWAWLATGHPQEAERCLQLIEASVGASVDDLIGDEATPAELAPEVQAALVEVAVVRAQLHADHLQLATAQRMAERVLPYLQELDQLCLFNYARDLWPPALTILGLSQQLQGDVVAAEENLAKAAASGNERGNVHIVAVANGRLAATLLTQGRLNEAESACRRGLDQIAQLAGERTPLGGILYAQLGLLDYERNNLDAAAQHLTRGYKLARQWGNWDGMLESSLGQAWLHRAQNERAAALAALDRLREDVRDRPLRLERALAAMRAFLLAEAGDTGAASAWIVEVGFTRDGAIRDERELEAIMLVRLLLLREQAQAAAEWAERLRARAETRGRWGSAVTLRALEAVALAALDNMVAAVRVLTPALRRGASAGYVRTFLDLGPALGPLLYEAAARGVEADYCGQLLAVLTDEVDAAVETGPPQEALVEPLSERELEVLALIAEGLTNREIAQKLVVSTGTVKVHAHNIYGKLNVGNRTEAVARGRALGLLH